MSEEEWDEKIQAKLKALRDQYALRTPAALELLQNIAEQQVILDGATAEIRSEGVTCSGNEGGKYQHPSVGTRRASIEIIKGLRKELDALQREADADKDDGLDVDDDD
jgi:hypothetical protein